MRMKYWFTVSALVATGTLGCSTHEASNGGMTKDTSNSPTPNPSSSPATSAAAADSIVRGMVKDLSDSVLTLSAPTGEVRIAVSQPLKVYSREPGDLSRVTNNAFIGVTSVPKPDGTQQATEIHVFPEELRGLGEGSRPMGEQAGGGRSRMTNGNVANSRMTNGAARMTNGTSHGAAGGTMTVEYTGGTQTITVPSTVPVTVIAPTTTKLTSGMSVVVPAKKRSNGTLEASLVVLAASRGR